MVDRSPKNIHVKQEDTIQDSIIDNLKVLGINHEDIYDIDDISVTQGGEPLDETMSWGENNVENDARIVVTLPVYTVVTWGNNDYNQLNTDGVDLTNAKAIVCGGTHSVALKNDGNVVSWGDNRYNQLDTPIDLRDVKAIACGVYHSVALMI